MVLRCSLLGHDYGEPEVDREREERGSEVVLTVQTYEECARCGDRHIISENTEITSLTPDERREADRVDEVGEAASDSPTEAGRDGSGGESDPAETGPGMTDEGTDAENDWPRTDADTAGRRSEDPVRGPGGADATNDPSPASSPERVDAAAGANTDGGTRPEVSDAETRSEPTGSGEPPASEIESDPNGPDRNVPTDDDGDPIEDGEIIEEDRGRKPGEWPDPDDVGPPTDDGSRGRWSNLDVDRVGGEELTYEDTENTDEANVAGESDGGTTSETDSGSPVTDSGTGIASAASAPVPGENPVVEPVDTEFYCPTCSFVAPGDHGSLRPGDICPDCGRGYIGERERK